MCKIYTHFVEFSCTKYVVQTRFVKYHSYYVVPQNVYLFLFLWTLKIAIIFCMQLKKKKQRIRQFYFRTIISEF